MTQDRIKQIAQERIKARQNYNIRRIQQLFNQPFETEGEKVVIPHEVFVEARQNSNPQWFDQVCKRLKEV